MTNQQTLAAFYQCHKQPRSFLECVESFRRFYPESTVHIVNDGGYDYSYYCARIGAEYSYVPKETRLLGPTGAFSSLEAAERYLTRLWNFISTTKETHFVLLEDDVRVIRHHRLPFVYSINGCNESVRLPDIMVEKLTQNGYAGPFHYGGCGGCVFDRQFFADIPFADVQSLLAETPLSEFHTDQLFTFFALYFGGSIGHYDEFYETFYGDIIERLVTDRVAFLHQYKFDYGREPSEEQRALLGSYR